MPNYFNSLKLKFVDAIIKLPTARYAAIALAYAEALSALSVDKTDFRLYEFLKNDSRSHDQTGQHTKCTGQFVRNIQ